MNMLCVYYFGVEVNCNLVNMNVYGIMLSAYMTIMFSLLGAKPPFSGSRQRTDGGSS